MPRQPSPLNRRRHAPPRGTGHPSDNPAARLDAALDARRPLIESGLTDAMRIFNAAADGIDGLVIERYGPVLIVQVHEGRLALPLAQVRALVEPLHRHLGTHAVYLKTFVRDRARPLAQHIDPAPWVGHPVEPQIVIREHGLRFAIRPYDGYSVGLFLDQRDNRRRIRALARGRRVLNAFCYTGGFSVAAVAGGAQTVASLDLSRRSLDWSRENFGLNNLDPVPHRFYCSDVADFYRRAARQRLRFDLVILDPPTFSRTRRPRRTFVLADQLDALVAGAASLLDPGGLLLLSTNDRCLSPQRLEAALARAAAPRRFQVVERPPLPPDFAGDPDYSKSLIARLA